MDSPFVGVIFAHAGTYAPYNWKLCQGQIIAISENEVLFTLIGTTYGGDGQTTFALPDLRGRVPIGQGQGLGLSDYVLGQRSGTETVTLNSTQLPQHNHLVNVINSAGNVQVPTTSSFIAGTYAGTTAQSFYSPGPSGTALAPNTIGTSGGNQPISIIQPILATNYIIAMFGVFPSRN